MTGSHGGSIAGVGRRGAGLLPGHAHEQPDRRRARPPPGSDITALTKQLGEACGEARRLPTPGCLEAPQQLSGQLGIVAVLTEGELRVGPLPGASGLEPSLDVNPGHLGGLGLDHESQRVAQRLSQNRPGQPIGRHPVAGATSRPQCLHTRARARIRSAQ